MSISFFFKYNSSSLRFSLIPWQFQTKMFRPMKLIRDTCHGCLCTTVAYLVVLGCLGTALVELLGEEVDFDVVSGFKVDLEVELTLACVNVNGLGGAGALREPIDSNRSFPVMLTLKMVFAALEIFRHMLDFKSSMSCLGLR